MQHMGFVFFINPLKIEYHLTHVATLRVVVLGVDELSWPTGGQREIDGPVAVLRSIATASAIKFQKWTVNKQGVSQDCGGRGPGERSQIQGPQINFKSHKQVAQF